MAASQDRETAPEPPIPLRNRVLYTVAVVGTAAIAVILLWWLRWVFCLAFLAILFAVFLRGGADLLAYVLRRVVVLKPAVSLGLFCLIFVAAVAGFVYYAVPSIAEQGGQLREELPASMERLENQLRQSRWGTWLVEEGEAIVDQVRSTTRAATQPSEDSPVADPQSSSGQSVSGSQLATLFRHAAGWATSAVTAIVALLFILFTGLYLAVDPALYQRGILWLVPPRGRRKADCVLKRVGHTLRYWLMGQLVAMLIVGLLAGVGLWILGAPLPLVLGTLAAFAEFVPNLGPFIAASLPTVMAATSEGRFLDGPSLAVAVLILFLIIQSLESYVITPIIQQRAVELPPALLITTQLAAALLLGPLGVIIAAPLVASVMAALSEVVVVGDPDREHPKDRVPA